MCSVPGCGRPRRNLSVIRASTLGSAPHSCLLVAVADPKRSQDGHVTSLSSPGRAAHSHLLPQGRRVEARVNSRIFGECQGPILKGEPGPGRGK